jgi:hypothetical protein
MGPFRRAVRTIGVLVPPLPPLTGTLSEFA